MPKTFENLRIQLEQEEWPSLYYFKFITPSDNQKIALITKLFDETSEINMRPSSNGKYTSISVKEVVMNADSVINIYKEVAKIKGVIIL